MANSDVDVCIVNESYPLHLFGGSVFHNAIITTCITYSIFFARCLPIWVSVEFASGFVMNCSLPTPPNGIHLSSAKIFGCLYVETHDKNTLLASQLRMQI